jgi:tetratricopeptide (TPR) repeat protein
MELMRRNPGDAQGLANLAITEIAMGSPEKALAYLDEALTLKDPPLFKIYFHQGVARSKLGRLGEAVAWYRKAEALDPEHTHLLFNMAVTYDRLERYKEALACYARFLKADETSSPRERRDVETRVGILMAYLVEAPKTPSAEGTHRQAE